MIDNSQLEAMLPYELEDLIKRANQTLLKKIYGFKPLDKTTNELRLQT